MRPELLSNPVFVRYYQQWQNDPASICFAAVAEFFLQQGELAEAIRVCSEGLQHHPELITPRLTLAKAFFRQQEWERARAELQLLLTKSSGHSQALELLQQVERALQQPAPVVAPAQPASPFATLTMAKLYANQGHTEKAREICEMILKHDPSNETVLEELRRL